jgi:phosphohistidine phosphatase
VQGEVAFVELYLIRHADALALGERGITDDAERPLSENGAAQSRTVGLGLQRKSVGLDKLVTSPLLRARQTAEGILRVWSPPAPELLVCDDLAPGSKLRKLGRYLRDLGGERVGLVGHMPHIGELAAWLIGSRKAQVDVPKAGVALIRTDDEPRKRAGTLQWLVGPEWFGE